MEAKITNIGLNQNSTQTSLDGLKDEVGKLRSDVETLRARMQTQINANRFRRSTIPTMRPPRIAPQPVWK